MKLSSEQPVGHCTKDDNNQVPPVITSDNLQTVHPEQLPLAGLPLLPPGGQLPLQVLSHQHLHHEELQVRIGLDRFKHGEFVNNKQKIEFIVDNQAYLIENYRNTKVNTLGDTF